MSPSNLWKKLTSRSSKGALTLILGTALGQLITLGVTPLLARMYSSEDFGYLSLVLSAASIVTPAAALRLESALMLPRSARNATALLGIGTFSAVCLSVLAAAILQVLFSFGVLTNMARLPWFSLWVAAIVFLTAVFTLLSQFALRRHRYGAVARRGIYQSTLAAGAQVGFGLIGASAGGLIGGYALGRLAGIAPLAVVLRGEVQPFRRIDAWRVLRRYWRFPVLFAPSAILNAAGLVLPLLFVGAWFSVSDAGQWAMADRILAAPLVLVATAVGQVVEAHMSETLREARGGLGRYYLAVSGVLLLIAIAMVGIIVFAGPWALPVLLGPGWETATDVMIAMTPLIATRLIASPMSKILVVMQSSGWTLGLDILRVVLVLAAIFFVTASQLDLIEAAWCFSFVLGAVYVVTWGVGLLLAIRGTDHTNKSSR